MRRPVGTRPGERATTAGAAMTEAALVMIPLLFFLLLTPGIVMIWANEQNARAEAHRDMFDKTTTIMLIAEPFASEATARARRHAMPGFPPSPSTYGSSLSWAGPDGNAREATVGRLGKQEIFPDGWPNQFVEGWKYREKFEYRGGWWGGEMDLMRYGAVIRSPWTMMGWPFVPTQDMWWEPTQMQSWQSGLGVDKLAKKLLKLMD